MFLYFDVCIRMKSYLPGLYAVTNLKVLEAIDEVDKDGTGEIDFARLGAFFEYARVVQDNHYYLVISMFSTKECDLHWRRCLVRAQLKTVLNPSTLRSIH